MIVRNIGPYISHVESKQSKAVDGKFYLQYSCKNIIIIFAYG